MPNDIGIDELQAAKAQNEAEGQRRLPVYFVLDTSYSMTQNDRIGALKNQVPLVLGNLAADPELDNKVRVSVLTMANDTTLLHSMRRPSELPTTFDLTASGGTNYTSAFEMLRREIEKDYKGFAADGVLVYRAAVLFLTDGEPICDAAGRAAAYAQLTDPKWTRYPYTITVGIGKGVNGATLSEYAYPSDALVAAKPAKKPKDPGDKPFKIQLEDDQASASTISELVAILIRSIVNSGASSNEPVDPDAPRDLDEEQLARDITEAAAAATGELDDDDDY